MSDLIAKPSRRGFLRGLGLIIAAPAIVRASSLMPVKSISADLGTGNMVYRAYEYRWVGMEFILDNPGYGEIVPGSWASNPSLDMVLVRTRSIMAKAITNPVRDAVNFDE